MMEKGRLLWHGSRNDFLKGNGFSHYRKVFVLDFEINKGEVVAILGPSGSGKTTFLRCLNLLERPEQGKLVFTDGDLKIDFSRKITKSDELSLRRRSSMVFQQYHLWPHLTVIENLIEAPMKVRGVSENEAKADAMELLKRLRLEEHADRFPLHLSGGQQQRVAIARALMMKPQVLLFDEPTAALDPEITAQVVDIIKELQQTGITQVIVTHEVNVAQKVATKVVYMEQGKIIEMGSADCFDNPKTEQFKQYLSHSE